MMSDFQQLYVGEEGYVVRCTDCGYLQCAFGSIVLTLQAEDFRTLMQLAGTQLEHVSLHVSKNMKQYWLPTAHSGVNMLLTLDELRQFHHMLEKADTEMAVHALMGLFADV